jgi:hypothetical protein
MQPLNYVAKHSSDEYLDAATRDTQVYRPTFSVCEFHFRISRRPHTEHSSAVMRAENMSLKAVSMATYPGMLEQVKK